MSRWHACSPSLQANSFLTAIKFFPGCSDKTNIFWLWLNKNLTLCQRSAKSSITVLSSIHRLSVLYLPFRQTSKMLPLIPAWLRPQTMHREPVGSWDTLIDHLWVCPICCLLPQRTLWQASQRILVVIQQALVNLLSSEGAEFVCFFLMPGILLWLFSCPVFTGPS